MRELEGVAALKEERTAGSTGWKADVVVAVEGRGGTDEEDPLAVGNIFEPR